MSLTFQSIEIPVGSPLVAKVQCTDQNFMYWIRLQGVRLSFIRIDVMSMHAIHKSVSCVISVPFFKIEQDFHGSADLAAGEIFGIAYIPLGMVAVTPWLESPLDTSLPLTLHAEIRESDVVLQNIELTITLPDCLGSRNDASSI